MVANQPAPSGRNILGRPLLQFRRTRVPGIDEAQVVACLPQRRCSVTPPIDAPDGTRRHLDPARPAAGDQAAVCQREILGQAERPIALAGGREHDRMSPLREQLDHAVEVAGLGNVVEQEQDADDPYLIITSLDMLPLEWPRAR